MSYSKRMTWTEKLEIGAGDMWWVYAAIGYPLTKSARSVDFINNTNVDIWITTDPMIDMLKLAPYSYEMWDIGTHMSLHDKPLLIDVGTQFYARCSKIHMPNAGTWVSVHCLIPEINSGS